jgi:hypothetical protein
MSGEEMKQFADFANRRWQIANLKSPDYAMNRWTNRQSLNHPIARSPDHPMTERSDQEELTLLLDAGRNICPLCWGAWMPILAKVLLLRSARMAVLATLDRPF